MISLPIDCVLDAKAQIGEGAIWCSKQQVLYWVDIPAGILHRFDPSNNSNKSWSMGEALGCFALPLRTTGCRRQGRSATRTRSTTKRHRLAGKRTKTGFFGKKTM